MGVNVVNSVCELIRPAVEGLTGGKVKLAILTNLSTGREHRWTRSNDGGLAGELEISLSVGNATERGQVAASVGLASNIGALYTLVSEGMKNLQ